MTITMIDAMHAYAGNIPVNTAKVAGYTTGTTDVQWTSADWGRFPRSGHVRIEQGYGTFNPFGCDAFDVELNQGVWSITPGQAAEGVRTRIAGRVAWTTVYADDSALAQVVAALDAVGPAGWYDGRVDCWLADWNLSEAQAAALIGTKIHGLICRAVQWASPTSNPRTPLPGSSLTLAQANCDLSVTQDSWHAYAAAPPPPPQGYRHLTQAGDTIAAVAASRNMEPEKLLARCAADYTDADKAALFGASLPAGLAWYTDKP